MTTLNNFNKQLFTELTSTESATVTGGATECFTNDILFVDPRIDPVPRPFKVSPGNGQREDFDRILKVGKDTTYWNNVKGGSYTIKFTDEAYNSEIGGKAKTCYS